MIIKAFTLIFYPNHLPIYLLAWVSMKGPMFTSILSQSMCVLSSQYFPIVDIFGFVTLTFTADMSHGLTSNSDVDL